MIKTHHADFAVRMPEIETASIDAIISDPPYAMTNLSWDKAVDWEFFWSEARRVLIPTGIVVLFSAQKFTTDLINSNRPWFRYELIWEKSAPTRFLDANRRPLSSHENILIFAPRLYSTPYNPQKTPGKPYFVKRGSGSVAAHYSTTLTTPSSNPTGERHPRSVLRFASERRSGNHPSQKPLLLMEWLILTYTNPGQTVLDPFMGSGTTGVACHQHQRKFIGIEREEKYFEMANNRLSA